MNTIPTSLPAATSTNPPDTIELTPEEKRFNELSKMAISGIYARGVTAKDLAAAKRKPIVEMVDAGGGNYEPWLWGGESVLHEAARSGYYPPGTTLELLAETQDAQRHSPLRVALLMCRDFGTPLPRCCTALALARYKPSFGQPTWLHYAATCGFTPPDTTPELLINTADDGWTALHAAARSDNLIPGITIRMLKCTVSPVGITGELNFSALEAFKKHVDRALRWLSEGTSPLSKQIINSTKNLLRASVASVPNLESLQEVRELAEVLRRIAPVETVLWFAAELAGYQQRFVDAVKASVPSKPDPEGQRGNAGNNGKGRDEFPCPKCGGKMAVRTATTGKNKGKQFLGCAAYPKCKSMRTLDGNIISV